MFEKIKTKFNKAKENVQNKVTGVLSKIPKGRAKVLFDEGMAKQKQIKAMEGAIKPEIKPEVKEESKLKQRITENY